MLDETVPDNKYMMENIGVCTTDQDSYAAESKMDEMYEMPTNTIWIEGSQEEKDEYVQNVPTTAQPSYLAESQTDGMFTANTGMEGSQEVKYEYVQDVPCTAQDYVSWSGDYNCVYKYRGLRGRIPDG